MSLELLQTWRELLHELADLGRALCRAIEREDMLAAIAAMVELRRVRAAIARADAPQIAHIHGGADTRAVMAEIHGFLAGTHDATRAMTLWLARGIPGDPQLLRSPLGVAVLADAMLPAVWDYDTDPVVLVGAGLEPVAELLADLGQRRMIVHGGLGGGGAPRGAIATVTDDELVAALRTMTPCPPARFVLRTAIGVTADDGERLSELVRATLGDLRIHRNTVHAFSRTWIEQGIANLPAIARWPSIAALDGKLTGKPMVIVAPGPSLAGNVAALRALRGRAIITAFSHSLRPVLAAGIVPDLVLTVDPQDVRYHFAGCDVSQTCLVNAATAHPSLFELGAPRCLTLSANAEIDDWMFDALGERPIAPGGGSVATSAFSLALRWGCDPIIFVGLDLSFPGGNYYVGTSADGDARAVMDADGHVRVEGWSADFHAMKARGGPSAVVERVVELPSWSGSGSVPSSFMFSMFHRWFVDRVRQANDQTAGVRVYNCTEGGAYIDGMMHRRLADVIDELGAPVGVTAILDAAIAEVTPARGARLAARLRRLLGGIRVVRRLAQRARTLASGIDREQALAATEHQLAAALRSLVFVSLLAQREIERAQDVAQRPADAQHYLAASAKLFDTLLRVTEQVAPTLRAAAATLARAPLASLASVRTRRAAA